MVGHREIDFRYAPPSVWTSICRPDDPHKSLVREDGALLYGFQIESFEAWTFRRVIEFRIQAAAQRPLEVTQRTESARVPVVITTLRYPRATLELRTFGHLHDGDRRTDVVLWEIRAHDDVDEFLTGLHIDAYEQHRVFVGRSGHAPTSHLFAADPATLPTVDRWSAATKYLVENSADPEPGELAFILSPQKVRKAHTTGFRPCTGLAATPVILHAGETTRGAVIFPLNHAQADGLDYAWAERALETERAYWQSLPLPALPLEVPDPAVMDMLTACARNILQAREIEHGLPVFKVGPTVYRNLFVVDGHFMLETAQYLGYRNEAAAAIDTLLRRVRPNGAIAEMLHHTKETGISIATLIRQCELLGDEALLHKLWPTIRNGVAYIEGLREEARALSPDDPCAGLLPRAFGDGGVGGDRGEYTTALWILFGLKWATEAAKRFGYPEDAARFGADFESLMADFQAHARKNMRTLDDGTPYLPMTFPGSGEHHWIPDYPEPVDRWRQLQPESATWAFCQAVWPGEVFTPDDPLVQNLLRLHDRIDDAEGIPEGTGWLPYRALWGYHASFAAHAWLYAGRPDKAVDYLYDFANHASTTRVWREEQSITATGNGQLFGEMPHNWASAEFIRLVRHLLVLERGECLELLPGLPPEWMKPGATIRVERTPTRFGPVTLHARMLAAGQMQVEVSLDPTWPRKPEAIYLMVPSGTQQVTINGEAAALDNSGRVAVPAAAASITVAM